MVAVLKYHPGHGPHARLFSPAPHHHDTPICAQTCSVSVRICLCAQPSRMELKSTASGLMPRRCMRPLSVSLRVREAVHCRGRSSQCRARVVPAKTPFCRTQQTNNRTFYEFERCLQHKRLPSPTPRWSKPPEIEPRPSRVRPNPPKLSAPTSGASEHF